MNRLRELQAAGVSIWLDTLSRDLLEDRELERLRRDLAVTGATSNPTIFANAICGSDRYDGQLAELLAEGVSEPRELFFELALEDVRLAAREFEAVHAQGGGSDGFVSFEVTPDVADDTTATVAQATELWHRLGSPNVMIKVPATGPGVAAVEELTAAGINVNVTLLFAVERYGQVIEAYLRGLERRVRTRQPIGGVRSVASFFVSRVDAKADARLPTGSPLRGHVALANAHAAYARYRGAFAGARWQRLASLGAAPQRPLWASTAPKDPGYRDVLYLEQLALPESILTVPLPTLEAFADHGTPGAAVPPGGPAHALATARAAVDLDAITAELEHEGIEAFDDSYHKLLACIEERSSELRTASAVGGPA